jgi:nanoRNase/pAp phosphatase (c-di-AMP/oligoRNAs hydrolase)
MSGISKTDPKMSPDAQQAAPEATAPGESLTKRMTAFVESCVETVTGSAELAARHTRHLPHFRKLLRLLHDKQHILVTTHRYPDPDALASGWALCLLLQEKLPHAVVTMSVRDQLSGGINESFVRRSNLKLAKWDDAALKDFDAIILTDVSPNSTSSPLPEGVTPLAVIDHHRTRRKAKCRFMDIRPDVGATSTIIFSYYMEVEQAITPELAATLLYAIESDLAGAAGQPGELDNIALSGLTLLADTRKLYQMRYVDLPQSYYTAYYSGLSNALYYEDAILSHLETIDSPEKPAMIADFLLRFELVQWALVTAVYEGRLVISLRTSSSKLSAADMIRRLLRGEGDGGGHRTKAGGFIRLETNTPAEIERKRATLRRRYLRALGIKQTQGKRLIPKE